VFDRPFAFAPPVAALVGHLGGPADRQEQHPRDRHETTMREEADPDAADGSVGARDVAALEDRVDELRADLDAFEADVDERTLHRDEVEAELKRYIRRRMRRGHARGWGPYLVLLYGTVMTLGAFSMLDGVWAVLAMIILFLSTLGLVVLFVLVGVALDLLGAPGRVAERARGAADAVRGWRE